MLKAETINDIPRFFRLKPLDETDMQAYYEDTMEIRTGRRGNSPMDVLFEQCTMPSDNNAILFMGHRGCGKSTELNKLAMRLKDAGHPVKIIPCAHDTDLMNLVYSDLMILMADAVLYFADLVGFIPEREDVDILLQLLDDGERETVISNSREETGEVGAEVTTPSLLKGLLSAFANVKANLRTGIDTRDTYRSRIKVRMTVWLEAIDRIADGITDFCDGKQPVLIFEDLDKGLDSVWKAFEGYSALLTGVSFPVIYTFPCSYFYDHRFGRVENFFTVMKLPMIKTHNIDGTRCDEGIETIQAIVEKRVNTDLFEAGVLELLINKTGGSLRQLFRAISSSARISNRLGYDRIDMESAAIPLEEIKSDLSARISGEDYDFLVDICNGNHSKITDSELLKDMMMNEIVLEYNGTRWHDVHPLIVDYLRATGHNVR